MCFFGVVTRILVIVFGILLPARCTHKALFEVDLINWGKYWIVFACLRCLELVGDTILSWLPFYVETKLLLVVFLIVSAPQASVWMFDVILGPLLDKHMSKIDHFMLHGKQHMLGDALKLTSEFCARSLDTVLPVVSQIWKKPEEVNTKDSITQPIDENMISGPYATLGEQAVTDTFINPQENVYFDLNMDPDSFEVTFPSSQSHTTLSEPSKCSSRPSVPQLSKKVTGLAHGTHGDRTTRKQRAYDANHAKYMDPKDDLLTDMEDLLQHERLAIELQHRPIPPQKERRHYQ